MNARLLRQLQVEQLSLRGALFGRCSVEADDA
jgi:hypothetical protein